MMTIPTSLPVPTYKIAELFVQAGQPMTKNDMQVQGLSQGRIGRAIKDREIVPEGSKGGYRTYRLSDKVVEMWSRRQNLKEKIKTGNPTTLKMVRAHGLTPLVDANGVHSLAPFRHLSVDGVVIFDLNRTPSGLMIQSGGRIIPALSLYYEGLANIHTPSGYGSNGIPAIVESIPGLSQKGTEFISFKAFNRRAALDSDIKGSVDYYRATKVSEAVQNYPTSTSRNITLIAYDPSEIGGKGKSVQKVMKASVTIKDAPKPPPNRVNYASGYNESTKNFVVAKEFRGTLSKPLYVVQYHSESKLEVGRSCKWFMPVTEANKLHTIEQVMQRAALLSSFGERTHVTVAKLPAGEPLQFLHGRASPQVHLGGNFSEVAQGGGVQYRFYDFDYNWIVETRKIPTPSPLPSSIPTRLGTGLTFIGKKALLPLGLLASGATVVNAAPEEKIPVLLREVSSWTYAWAAGLAAAPGCAPLGIYAPACVASAALLGAYTGIVISEVTTQQENKEDEELVDQRAGTELVVADHARSSHLSDVEVDAILNRFAPRQALMTSVPLSDAKETMDRMISLAMTAQIMKQRADNVPTVSYGSREYDRPASDFIGVSARSYQSSSKVYQGPFSGYNLYDPPTRADRYFRSGGGGSSGNDSVGNGGGWCSDPSSPGCSKSDRSCSAVGKF